MWHRLGYGTSRIETTPAIPVQREPERESKQICGKTERGCGPVYTHDDAVQAGLTCRDALASRLIQEKRQANGGDFDVAFSLEPNFCGRVGCAAMVGVEKSIINTPIGECREQANSSSPLE